MIATWLATPADEDLRRRYPEPAFDDSSWSSIEVPGHWRSSAPFGATDGPLLHRATFDHDRPADGRRAWLTFEGIFYQADVWLDGSYVGDAEGYFFPHTFEVTEQLRDRTEHVLAVEVACSPQKDRTAKRNITGVFQHWDCLDPDWNPGGIWRPVHVHETGPIRIARLRVTCREATAERAVLHVRAVLDSLDATTVTVRSTIAGAEHVQEVTLAEGENRKEWNVVVDSPTLWWPHALGDQPLHDLTVTVGESDSRTVTTGIRQVRMRNWIVTVNGERLFLKGSNQGPTRQALAEATVDELERDVTLAKDAGLDFLRVHAHVTRPEFYEAADREGLLLWQDFPLQWGYARGIRKQAVRQVREAVDLLGHHPSIFLWCGHNEPMTIDVEPGGDFDVVKTAVTALVQQELPTWNKTILDRSVKRSFEKSDRSRPVVAHSGVFPHPGSGGTDSHLYFGWYWGEERDFPRLLSAWPRLARFVTEFGSQALPASDAFVEPERWPDLDWARLERTHALQLRFMRENGLDPADYDSFDGWRSATQRHQVDVTRFHIEAMRRLKYRPTGGFAHFCFADGHPAITWSVLDHERVPKPAYEALAAACAPVIVVADRLPATPAPGDALALDVHVVSDLRTPVEGARLDLQLAWTGGSHERSFVGDFPADSCVRVTTLQVVVPDAPGPLTLDLSLDGAGVKATNRYEATITRA